MNATQRSLPDTRRKTPDTPARPISGRPPYRKLINRLTAVLASVAARLSARNGFFSWRHTHFSSRPSGRLCFGTPASRRNFVEITSIKNKSTKNTLSTTFAIRPDKPPPARSFTRNLVLSMEIAWRALPRSGAGSTEYGHARNPCQLARTGQVSVGFQVQRSPARPAAAAHVTKPRGEPTGL